MQPRMAQGSPARRGVGFLRRSGAALALAALAGGWGLRNISSQFADPDAARHAMNGVLIRDWIAHGSPWHPMVFARRFFSHFPATTIPFHPPVFPMFESLFYFLWGVHASSAHMAIAAFTFGAVLSLYRLILKTHGSAAFALLSVAVTFLTPEFQKEAADAMLEMPALFFSLAALHFAWNGGRPLDWLRGIAFGLLVGVAIWTKQHSIAVAGVPFVAMALGRKWREMANRPLWAAMAIVAVAGAGLAILARLAHTGTNSGWESLSPATPFHNLAAYSRGFAVANGWAPALALGVSCVSSLVSAARGRQGPVNNFYVAWAGTVFGLVLALPFTDPRYLFNAYPPLVVLLFGNLGAAIRGRSARTVCAAATVAVLALLWMRPEESVKGPREAADFVMKRHPERILYLGSDNGNFIFAVRERDPNFRTVVVRGDKLGETAIQPAALGAFARENGIEYVVVERWIRPEPWQMVMEKPPACLTGVRRIDFRSPVREHAGQIYVFRVKDPAPHPRKTLRYDSDMVKTGLEVDLN